MFDTNIVIVGNVLTAPDWRRTANTNSLVAHFKVASTARRLDRETGRWVDGNSLRVRVNCWRKLAEGVAASVMVGDPIVVVGRLYTRDWTDADGNARISYEMEAVAVGHDLARGRGTFVRNRATATATSELEDAEAARQVRGEASSPVGDEEAPTRYGDGLFGDVPDLPAAAAGFDPIADVRGGGFDDPTGTGDELDPFGAAPAGDAPGDEPDPLDEPSLTTAPEEGAEAGHAPRSRRARRTPVPA